MTMAYDFDIFDVVPQDDDTDPDLQAFLIRNGLQRQNPSQQIALFRREETADALRRAPDAVRNYLIESGFGLNTYDSGAPSGFYPAKDEEARLALIARLTENAARFDLGMVDHNMGGFDLSGFLSHLSEAMPIDWPRSKSEAVDAISSSVPKSASVIATVASFAMAGVSSRLGKGVPLLGQLRRSVSSS